MKDFNIYIEKAKLVHNNFYDYSKSVYNGYKKKIIIICPIHGDFLQTPDNHIHGHGCPKCGNVHKPNTEEFIEKAKKIHGDKYDYSKVEYKTAIYPISIICPIHGEFLQTPNKHLNGRGCPLCKQSHMERDMIKLLNENNIQFIYQYKIIPNKKLSYDFYLPKYNIIIECQGEQHFSPINFYGNTNNNNEEKYNLQLIHDKEKYIDAFNNGIKLIYFTNKKYFMNKNINILNNEFYIDKIIYSDINLILKDILK